MIGPANLQRVAGCTCLAMAELSPDILEPTGRGFLPSLHRPRTPKRYLYGIHKSDRNPDLSLICTTVRFDLAGAEGFWGLFTFGAHHVHRKLSLMRSLEIRESVYVTSKPYFASIRARSRVPASGPSRHDRIAALRADAVRYLIRLEDRIGLHDNTKEASVSTAVIGSVKELSTASV